MGNKVDPFETDESGNVYPVLLDPDMAKIVGCASNAAYTDFDTKKWTPPVNPPDLKSGSLTFSWVARFTGFDNAAWGNGEVEKYGLIYQSQTEPDTYLFAFRGTVTTPDDILDIESVFPTEFTPYHTPQGFPSPVHVGDGFYKIYSDSTAGMPGSMREQLFQQVSALNPKHIIITGHSLGCPLGSLFALDLAASLPAQITTTTINFASPRVGTHTWQSAYNQYVSNTMPRTGIRNETIRIVNNYDEVPKVPPEGFPTYFRHVGRVFPVSFTTKDYHWDLPDIVLSWHSLVNYCTVVNNAVVSTPQGWSGEFPDDAVKGWEMVSYNPFQTRSSPLRDRLKGK